MLMVVFVVVAATSIRVGSNYAMLLTRYGYARVRAEQLTVIRERRHDAEVSNGDIIGPDLFDKFGVARTVAIIVVLLVIAALATAATRRPSGEHIVASD